MYGRKNNSDIWGCLGCLGGCFLSLIAIPFIILVHLFNSLFKRNSNNQSNYRNNQNDNESYKEDKSCMIESSSPIKENKRIGKRQVKDVVDYEEKVKKKDNNE